MSTEIETILFFDLDSTLVENRFSRKAIRELLQEIAAVTEKPIEELGHAIWQENSRRQQNDPDHPQTMDWNDIIQTIADEHGVTLSTSVDALWNQYAAADDVQVLDNAPQVLYTLQAPHRKLVLATKGLSKYQQPVLDVTGLDAYLDDILTPDITGYLKTSPEYFQRYQDVEALCIQIGDHYYDDVICAKRNGFRSILRAPIDQLREIAPRERPAQLHPYLDTITTYPDEGTNLLPDAVVVSLEELPPLIQQFEADSD